MSRLYNSSFSYFNESKPHINMEGSDITLIENKYSRSSKNIFIFD